MYPDRKKIYDIHKDYGENLELGPIWDGALPEVPEPAQKVEFMGRQLNSRLGVAASPLTANSEYVTLMGLLGYDVITHKSVRSVKWEGNQFPHWAHVVPPAILSGAILGNFVVSDLPIIGQESTMANSFGIHSAAPEFWQQDVQDAAKALSPHQLMILSLMCTPIEGQTLVDDARVLAGLAAETDLTHFELNLACPNTDGGAGLIYEDVEQSFNMAVAMKEVLGGSRKLLIKVGRYTDQHMLREFMRRATGIIDGISSTNTYSANVTKKDGSEYFPGRSKAGISGAAVLPYSLRQAANLVQFRDELGLDNFSIIGIGGVTKPADIEKYLELGVDAVQSVVGVYENPYLATQWKSK